VDIDKVEFMVVVGGSEGGGGSGSGRDDGCNINDEFVGGRSHFVDFLFGGSSAKREKHALLDCVILLLQQ